MSGSRVPQEIIVVDDASDPPVTQEHLRPLIDSHGTAVKILRLTHSVGSGFARNAGISAASCSLCLITDDDCLYQPDFVTRLHAAFTGLCHETGSLAHVLQPPVCHRTWSPTTSHTRASLPCVDAASGVYRGRFDAVLAPELCDIVTGHMAFAEVSELGGVFLCRRSSLLASGGYPEFPAELGVSNGYAIDSELGLRLQALNVRLWFACDTGLSVQHLKAGAPSTDHELDAHSVASHLLDDCRLQTSGCRVPSDLWLHCKATSYGFLFAQRNAHGMRRWYTRLHETIESGSPDALFSPGVEPVRDREVAHLIVRESADLVRQSQATCKAWVEWNATEHTLWPK